MRSNPFPTALLLDISPYFSYKVPTKTKFLYLRELRQDIHIRVGPLRRPKPNALLK